MSKITWLIFFSDGTDSEKYFTSVNLPFDCAVMASKKSKDPDGEVIIEAYRVDNTMSLETAKFAHWNAQSGLRVTNKTLYARRSSLDGKFMSVVTLNVSNIIIELKIHRRII